MIKACGRHSYCATRRWGPKRKKGPAAARPTGRMENFWCAEAAILSPCANKAYSTSLRDSRVGTGNAHPDKVVGRVHVICGVGHDRTPAIQARTHLDGSN